MNLYVPCAILLKPAPLDETIAQNKNVMSQYKYIFIHPCITSIHMAFEWDIQIHFIPAKQG